MAGRWQNISFDFSGASVLVTGGTAGLGAAIARAYREAGADVTITGTRAGLQDYDEDLSHYRYLRMDIEDKESIDAVAHAMSRLDVLVNNAGLLFRAIGLDEADPDVFDRALTVHIGSAFRLATRCRHLLRDSLLPGGASVIGMGSMTSFFGIPGALGYGSGKTGLIGMTRALAVEWASDNIRVNMVAAGTAWSRMTAPLLKEEGFAAPILARTPLGRHGDPDDISGVVLFLTSGAASWITGQIVTADGGFTVAG